MYLKRNNCRSFHRPAYAAAGTQWSIYAFSREEQRNACREPQH